MAYGSFYDQLLAATGKGTANYSFYAIPVMWGLCILPHIFAIVFLSGGKFSNVSPREFLGTVQRKEKKTTADAMYCRAESAMQNGLENLGFFAAAILAGNYAKLPAEELNALAGLYLASRAAFNVLYITTTNETASFMRSAVYFVGIFVNVTLFVRTGKAIN